MNKGKIVQVIGPVVDVEFPGNLPGIYNALTVEYDLPFQGKTKLTLEVQQHMGDNWVRAVAMSTTDGLKRGMEVTDTGEPISMPVGDAVMGRVFNVVGETGGRTRAGPDGEALPDPSSGSDAGGPVHQSAGAGHRHQGD